MEGEAAPLTDVGPPVLQRVPLREVTNVSKERSLGLPNSLSFVHGGVREFFTSFISRDEAYKTILHAW